MLINPISSSAEKVVLQVKKILSGSEAGKMNKNWSDKPS